MRESRHRHESVVAAVAALLFLSLGFGACGGDESGGTADRWFEDYAYQDPANGFEISHPPDWTAEKRDDEDHTVARFAPPGDTEVEVFVRAEDVEADALPPVETFVETWKKDAVDFELLSSETTTIWGQPALTFDYMAGPPEDRKAATVFVYLLNGRLYMFLGFAPADAWDTYETLIGGMAWSFRPSQT